MTKILTLSPLKSEPQSYDFIAFDTEGDGSLHGFKLACAWDNQGGHVFKRKCDLREYLFHPRNLGKRIVCANLEYDWSVAFQPFDDHHSILLNGSQWLSASYRDFNKHAYTAWDIQRIAPLSVYTMGKVIGLEKYTTPPNLIDDAIHQHNHFTCTNHHRTDCIECYCLRDAQIVYEFARLFQSELNALGGQMKMTAGSTTMDLWKRAFLDIEIAPTWVEKNDFFRRGLFGGRVENFKAGTDNFINAYDVNSLYPAVMRDIEIPLPNTFHHLPRTSHLSTRLDHFGMVQATIDVPRDYIPVLPSRVHKRNFYLTGKISGVFTFSELRYAIEHGARVVESGELVYADETVKPFRRFVDTLYERKTQYRNAKDAREIVIKLLLNSLWGKFAQRSDIGIVQLITPQGRYKLSDYDGCEPSMLAGHPVFLKPLDHDVQSPHIHVAWACEITAQARMRLHSMMEQVGEKLYYCDTDSIHTDKTLETGDGLGELKLANRFKRVTYLAPKEYGAVNMKGEWCGHAKGIPVRLQEEFLRKGLVRFKRPQHILEAIRAQGRIAEWRWRVKERRANPPTRDHPDLPDYNNYFVDTRPYDAAAVPEG